MTIKKAIEELKQGKILTFIWAERTQGEFYYLGKLNMIKHIHMDDDCYSLYTIKDFTKQYKEVGGDTWELIMNIY